MTTEYQGEKIMRVHTPESECYEIGPDADTGNMVEIRYRDEHGKLSNHHRISFPVEIWEMLRRYDYEPPVDS